MFLRTAWLVLRKDIAIEAKSWEVLTTTLFFAVSCVLIFAFAFVKDGREPKGFAKLRYKLWRGLVPHAAPDPAAWVRAVS